MERRFTLLVVCSIVVLLFGAFVFAMGAAQQEADKTKETVAQKCLGCHGSYDKIAEATAKFKASSGETVTPHQYVPHADKKDIPECTECHTPHPVPLEDKSKVVKPNNVDWCYSSCHHASNLQPCQTCH